MVARRKWLFDIGEYKRDTVDLSTAQHGAYLLLMMHYWSVGHLPDDEVQLQRITRTTPLVWSKFIRPAMLRFFKVPGWRHERLEADMRRSDRYYDLQKGKARKRWKGDAPQLPGLVDNSPDYDSMAIAYGSAPKSLKSQNPSDAAAMPRHANKKERDNLTVSGRRSPRASTVDNPGHRRARPPPNGDGRRRVQARQAWEHGVLDRLGPDGYATAIDMLASHPREVERCTDAELRQAGQGVVAALLALRDLAGRGNPTVT